MKRNELASTLAVLVARHIENSENNFAQSQAGFAEFRKEAQLLGFSVLGGGYFSVALEHEAHPELAIKVGLKREDSGAAYAAYCRANQGLPGIPVIHEIARWSNCYTVLMDNLESVEGKLGGSGLRSAYYSAVYAVIECGISVSEATDNVADRISNASGTCEEADTNYSYCYDLCKTAEGIRDFFYGIGSFDLHDGNVMFKGNELVITDPVSFTEGIKGWDAIDGGLDSIEVQKLEKFKMRKLMQHNKRKNRPAYLKMKNKLRKADYKRRAKMEALWRLDDIDEKVNCTLRRSIDHAHGWRLGRSTLEHKAHQARDADHVALICGQPLRVDKMLDGMLMG